jgi:hypothetical protein
MKNKDSNKKIPSPLSKKLEGLILQPDDDAWEQFQVLRQTQTTPRYFYAKKRWLLGIGLLVIFISTSYLSNLISIKNDSSSAFSTTPSVSSTEKFKSNITESAATKESEFEKNISALSEVDNGQKMPLEKIDIERKKR